MEVTSSSGYFLLSLFSIQISFQLIHPVLISAQGERERGGTGKEDTESKNRESEIQREADVSQMVFTCPGVRW